MKITKIYSNKDMQEANFNETFNVVFAKVNHPKDESKDSHNLGKSTLISLIDFMLLKELKGEHFLKKNFQKFKNHTFFMEIQNNEGHHLTIKRGVANNTKISFHSHKSKNVNLVKQAQWEQENVAIRRAKADLNNFLGFSVLEDDNSYRDTISYFLRNQYDYKDVFQLEKNVKGKDVDWKPMLFKLLGFPEKDLIEKYNKEIECSELQKAVKRLEAKSHFANNEKDKILGITQVKENDKKKLRQQLDNFNFILSEKKIKKEVVEDIENRVNKLNSTDYDLRMEEERVQKSLQQKTSFQIDECNRVFDEVNLHFPKDLLASYEELVEFHKDITSERNTLLKARLKSITSQRRTIEDELALLNEKRSEYLSCIRSGDTFKKYKEYEKQIEDISNEIFELRKEIENFNAIDIFKKDIKKLDAEIEKLKESIATAVGSGENSFYNQFRATFTQIVRDILGVPAILSLRINTNGNIEFKTDIQKNDEITLTDEGKGTSYKKILCVAFDLTLLAVYSNRSFFKFVYHDGVLEGLDNRMKAKFIACIRGLIQSYGFQYILSVIEDDIPKSDDNQRPLFTEDEIAIRLSDEDAQGRLFKTDF